MSTAFGTWQILYKILDATLRERRIRRGGLMCI